MKAIRTEALTRTFGDVRALDALALEIPRGEIFGLVGPDGAGKTTTMRLLTAILEPTAGNAWVLGHSVREAPDAIHDRIGYMSQGFGLYPDLSVDENIDFYADLYGVSRRARASRVEELLAFSNLTPFRRRLAGRLSGGMKQKLGLVCALVHTPEVLFLDEPTNGVDPVSRRDLWRILYGLLREKVTIFVSTAYLDEAERCSRVGLLNEGRLLALGTPAELRRLIRGSLLEMRTSDARETVAVLRREWEDGEVALFGDRVHVEATGGEGVRERLAALLARHGIEVEGMESIEASLEDVFVSVVGRNARGAGREGR